MSASKIEDAVTKPEAATEHFDVLVIGAGIAGIGAARGLQQECPNKSYVVLDAMENFGGTWHCHTYPGIRSDSDLYTFGYRFKPWIGNPIASREAILRYLGEVIEEHDLGQNFRYGHRVQSAEWDSKSNLWTLLVDTGKQVQHFTGNFLWMCPGYYRHAKGYQPDWPDFDKFEGTVCILKPARGSRLQGQTRDRHRLRCDRGDSRASACWRLQVTHHVAAFSDLFRAGRESQPPGQHAARDRN